MENKDVVVVDESKAVVVAEQGGLMSDDSQNKYYSVIAETQAEKIALYNAINTPDFRVADQINKTIKIKDVLIEMVEMVDQDTGEVNVAPRSVIIDDKGKSYQCVSGGIFNSIKRIVGMFGEPSTWNEPLEVEIKQITKGKNQILSMNIVG